MGTGLLIIVHKRSPLSFLKVVTCNIDHHSVFNIKVDAAHYGNLSHFINHCCNPNLSIFNIKVDAAHYGNLSYFINPSCNPNLSIFNIKVDAAHYGNLSHFINHSCDPNLSIFNVYINCLDPNLPQLCLFARR